MRATLARERNSVDMGKLRRGRRCGEDIPDVGWPPKVLFEAFTSMLVNLGCEAQGPSATCGKLSPTDSAEKSSEKKAILRIWERSVYRYDLIYDLLC